jgi:hypothetical protein
LVVGMGGEAGVIAVTRAADFFFDGRHLKVPTDATVGHVTTVCRQVGARSWIEIAQGSQYLMWRPCPRIGCRAPELDAVGPDEFEDGFV